MARSEKRAALRAAAALGCCVLVAGCRPEASSRGPQAIALVVTPSASADPATYRGAEALVAADRAAETSAAEKPSRAGAAPYAAVRHAVMPDAKTAKARAAALSALLLESAKDPLVRAILVVPAIEGSAEAFSAFRARRHDVALIAAESSEDRLTIEAAADLVVGRDLLYRPYFAALRASEAGARKLVAATARDPLSAERERELAVLRAASADLGLSFSATVPEGGSGDRPWFGTLDSSCALYCADGAPADSVIAAALASGASVVDGGPESLDAYARALAPLLPGDFPAAAADKRLKLLEKAAVSASGRGRLSTWTRGYAAESVGGLAEFARRVALGSARADDLKGLVGALKSASTGSAWIAAYDADPDSGVKSANRVLLRQDPYAFGRGYAQTAIRSMPPKYLSVGLPSR